MRSLRSVAIGIIQSALRRRGYEIRRARTSVTTVESEFWPWVRDTENIRTLIDIGANNGEWAASTSGYLRPKSTYVFEPQPSCVRALEALEKSIPNLRVFGVALSDRPGRKRFYENSYGPSSSLLHVSDLHKTEFPETAGETPTTVATARLDDVLDARALEKNIFIKVDVQGIEDQVIRGGRQVFAAAQCVLIEMSFAEMYESQPLFEEVHFLLVGLGFRFAGMKNQIDSPRSGRPLFGHCLYVRSDRPVALGAPEVELSVVVGTLNRKQQLQACVESIFDETRTPVRVYVTDAGSTDGTIEYLESIASDRLVPIFEGRRVGQARAYNQVFEKIETPYVCWLSDDDVVVNRGLDTAVAILDGEPRLGMVGLKVKDVAGPFAGAPYIGGVSSIGILNVNQGVLRTAILRKVGGFSEAFRDYGIDPDLTTKVLLSGHAVAYTREIGVHHSRDWGADAASEERARQMKKQRTYMDMYRRKYAAYANGGIGWRLKKASWRLLRAALRPDLDSNRRHLGLLVRDWHNILTGRYISVLDPVLCRRRSYHLLQRCPPRERALRLPTDPLPDLAAPAAADGGALNRAL